MIEEATVGEGAAEQAPGAPNPPGAPHTSWVRAVAVVLAGLAATGVAIGALWSWMAPPIHGAVALTKRGERVHAYLGSESDHFFVAAALMLGLLTVVAVVSAALVWQWQAHRGPGMVVALTLGVLAADAVAVAVGALLVHLHYGVVDIDGAPVTPDNRVYYVTEAPPVFFGHTVLHIVASLALPAAAAALVYALCAAAHARDDLGGYPVVELPAAPVADGEVSAAGEVANRR